MNIIQFIFNLQFASTGRVQFFNGYFKIFIGISPSWILFKRDKEIEDLIFPSSDHSDLKLIRISTSSQVYSAFYSTKTHPHKDDEGGLTSPFASDFNGPLPPAHQCNVIHVVLKDFFSHKLIG